MMLASYSCLDWCWWLGLGGDLLSPSCWFLYSIVCRLELDYIFIDTPGQIEVLWLTCSCADRWPCLNYNSLLLRSRSLGVPVDRSSWSCWVLPCLQWWCTLWTLRGRHCTATAVSRPVSQWWSMESQSVLYTLLQVQLPHYIHEQHAVRQLGAV